MIKNLVEAKQALDKIITKSRVHLYKPIQIAEILYRDRLVGDVDILNLETYRTSSKKWRDVICLQFLGRTSTSSARYQDDIFNENAMPPRLLQALAQENKNKNGVVEAYIYKRFAEKFSQLGNALSYCKENDINTFDLPTFLELFWHEPGLKRSIDKVYEIITFALFSSLVDAIGLTIEVTYNADKQTILEEFSDFAVEILGLDATVSTYKTPAKIYRVGVTNAADRGLDMWANFGLAIQIKHLSLDVELAQNIVHAITADRIVIVCKEAEQKVIQALLTQIGWKARIQSIVTEKNLFEWYERALRGNWANQVGNALLESMEQELIKEFPATSNPEFEVFEQTRGYKKISTDVFWV